MLCLQPVIRGSNPAQSCLCDMWGRTIPVVLSWWGSLAEVCRPGPRRISGGCDSFEASSQSTIQTSTLHQFTALVKFKMFTCQAARVLFSTFIHSTTNHNCPSSCKSLLPFGVQSQFFPLVFEGLQLHHWWAWAFSSGNNSCEIKQYSSNIWCSMNHWPHTQTDMDFHHLSLFMIIQIPVLYICTSIHRKGIYSYR